MATLLGEIESLQMQTKLYHDANDDTYTVKRTQSQEALGALVRRNQALYNDDDQGWSPSREWRRVASIDPILIEQWKSQGIDFFTHEGFERVLKMLDSSEYLKLRTAPGTIL